MRLSSPGTPRRSPLIPCPTPPPIPPHQVTADTTAEFFSPPSLALPGRPTITRVGQFPQNKPRIVVGDQIVVEVQTAAPIEKALLIRTGATTHSMPFGEQLCWL